MMSRTSAIAMMVLLNALPLLAQAQQTPPPLELKGVQIGVSTADDVREKFAGARTMGSTIWVRPADLAKAKCGDNLVDTGVMACRGKAIEPLRLAGGPAGEYWFHLLDGKVESVSVDFYAATGFKLAAGALELKYGAPSTRTVEAWRNRAGATFESSVAVWNREDGSIRLEERGAKVDESRLVMSSHKYRRHAEEEFKRRQAEGAAKL